VAGRRSHLRVRPRRAERGDVPPRLRLPRLLARGPARRWLAEDAISDDLLAQIDAEANGNRSAFLVAAGIEAARRARRERIDREIAADVAENDDADARVYAEWECTLNDGLDEHE
jgi:hypothetical protein